MTYCFGPDDEDSLDDILDDDEEDYLDEEDRDPAEILDDDVDESVYGDD